MASVPFAPPHSLFTGHQVLYEPQRDACQRTSRNATPANARAATRHQRMACLRLMLQKRNHRKLGSYNEWLARSETNRRNRRARKSRSSSKRLMCAANKPASLLQSGDGPTTESANAFETSCSALTAARLLVPKEPFFRCWRPPVPWRQQGVWCQVNSIGYLPIRSGVLPRSAWSSHAQQGRFGSLRKTGNPAL